MQLEGSNAEYEQQRELLSKTRAEYSQLKSVSVCFGQAYVLGLMARAGSRRSSTSS